MGIEEHFRELAASQAIEGALLRCTKGVWQLDGEEIQNPAEMRIVALLDTVSLGEILFRNGELVEQRVGRIADGFRPAEKVTPPWTPSTSFVCIDTDGQVMTFRSSSWGGRHAFDALKGSFMRLRCRQYPIVTLATTKCKRSGNDVIDPALRICGWTPRESAGLVGAAAPVLPAPSQAERGKIAVASGRKHEGDEESAGARPFAPLDDELDDNIPY
jgi:hypothetical protein